MAGKGHKGNIRQYNAFVHYSRKEKHQASSFPQRASSRQRNLMRRFESNSWVI